MILSVLRPLLIGTLVLLALCCVLLPPGVVPAAVRQTPLLLATLALALLLGGSAGLLLIFALGLCLDALLFLPLGSYALTLTLMGSLLLALRQALLRQPLWQHLIIIAVLLSMHEIGWTELLARIDSAAVQPGWPAVVLTLVLWLPVMALTQGRDERF